MPKKRLTFWNVALFAGLLALSFLFWLNSHVGYQAKSALLVKSSPSQNENIAKTLAAFGDTEVFQERTLGSTRLQESEVGALEQDEKEALVKTVNIEGGKKGGLVTLTVKADNQEAARIVSQEAMETILRMNKIYLNTEGEIAVSVIDEAIITKAIVRPVSLAVKTIVSAVVLFGIITLVQLAFAALKKYGKKKPAFEKLFQKKKKLENEFLNAEGQDERFVPQKLDPAFLYAAPETYPIEPQQKASELIKHEEYGEAPKGGLQSVSVSMDDLPFKFETSEEPKVEEVQEEKQDEIFPEEEIPEVTEKPEPTVLEYKRRLNELLAQK